MLGMMNEELARIFESSGGDVMGLIFRYLPEVTEDYRGKSEDSRCPGTFEICTSRYYESGALPLRKCPLVDSFTIVLYPSICTHLIWHSGHISR
jgi:hypothetical protein